jgi:preprotein translocase subunit SecD
VNLRHEAAERFETATRRFVGSHLVMTLGDKLIAARLVEAGDLGGRIRITLSKHAMPTRDLADMIALALKAGELLPVPLPLLQERRVPPRAR